MFRGISQALKLMVLVAVFYLILSMTLHTAFTAQHKDLGTVRIKHDTQKSYSYVRKVLFYKNNEMHDHNAFVPEKWLLYIRAHCNSVKGILSLDYKRCFHISDHRPKIMYLTQQLESCEKEGSKLCYPRSLDEMKFLQQYFFNWARRNIRTFPEQSDDYNNIRISKNSTWRQLTHYLHNFKLQLGFRKNAHNLFTSIDERFNISSRSASWFYSWDYFQQKKREFHGPSVCLSMVQTTPVECRLTHKNLASLCCRDFFFDD